MGECPANSAQYNQGKFDGFLARAQCSNLLAPLQIPAINCIDPVHFSAQKITGSHHQKDFSVPDSSSNLSFKLIESIVLAQAENSGWSQ
jgi:hypothetical protein